MSPVSTRTLACGLVSAATLAAVLPASAQDLSQYYVGVDTSDVVPFGVYNGLDNPNDNRLTFLFNHASFTNPQSSHYHSIGRYFYEGPVESPTVTPTNGNNRLPESYTGLQLELAPAPAGSPLAGKLVSGVPGAGNAFDEYGDLEIRMTDSIPRPGDTTYGEGDVAFHLFNSSSGSYTAPVAGLDIELELLDITPGLSVADAAGNVLMDEVGDTADLFDGAGSFTPTFFTDADAAPGVYSASFQLNDDSGTYLSSGTFHVDFTVVPEPATLGLLAAAGLGLIRRR